MNKTLRSNRGVRSIKRSSGEDQDLNDLQQARPKRACTMQMVNYETGGMVNASDPFSQGSEQDIDYEVEEILGSRRVNGRLQYRIKWKNYGPDWISWEPEEFCQCPSLIEEYTKRENQRQLARVRANSDESDDEVTIILEIRDLETQGQSRNRNQSRSDEDSQNRIDKNSKFWYISKWVETSEGETVSTSSKVTEASAISRSGPKTRSNTAVVALDEAKNEPKKLLQKRVDRGKQFSIQSVENSGRRKYEADKILAKKKDRLGRIFYLVSWKGLTIAGCTWEPESAMRPNKNLLEEFENSRETNRPYNKQAIVALFNSMKEQQKLVKSALKLPNCQ